MRIWLRSEVTVLQGAVSSPHARNPVIMTSVVTSSQTSPSGVSAQTQQLPHSIESSASLGYIHDTRLPSGIPAYDALQVRINMLSRTVRSEIWSGNEINLDVQPRRIQGFCCTWRSAQLFAEVDLVSAVKYQQSSNSNKRFRIICRQFPQWRRHVRYNASTSHYWLSIVGHPQSSAVGL